MAMPIFIGKGSTLTTAHKLRALGMLNVSPTEDSLFWAKNLHRVADVSMHMNVTIRVP